MPSAPSIVDAHHHVWDLAARPQPWLDTDSVLAPLRRSFLLPELIPQAAAVGVTATVVVQTVSEPGETPELLSLAAGPLVAAAVGWTDLAAPTVTDAISELAAMPGGQRLAGIRHPLLTEPDPGWLDRADIRQGLSALAVAGLTFDVVLRPGQLPAAVRAAASLPDLRFVLDHLGNVEVRRRPDPAWAAAFVALARLPNTVCKLSGIFSVPAPAGDPGSRTDPDGPAMHLSPYLDLALDSFGPDRLMFGSDWPVCTLGASYDAVVTAALALTSELSDTERAAILGGTARAVYQIRG
ncbi:MAG: amidohydrolase family protein [Streptosporangiaceae bacterium]